MDEISSAFLNEWLIKNKFKESIISNCLIFFDKDGQADIFINCPTKIDVTVKDSSINRVTINREDISDIHKVTFSGVHLRPELAVIYIFSNGWRKGVYFNFLPIDTSVSAESENLNEIFGRYFAYLIFPEIYRYQEIPDLKLKLYQAGWFPFIRLLGHPFNEIFNALKNNLPISDFEANIIALFKRDIINSMLNSWINNQNYKKRESILKNGIEEYFEGDYISAIHVLSPCIEGILQDLSFNVNVDGNSGEKLTTKLLLYLKSKHYETRLMLPENFKEYLIKSYFSKFDRNAEDIKLSRHSIAHGAVTDKEEFTQVRTLQYILILDQLSFYLES